MPIKKVFAMHAPPSDIYAALQRDLASTSEHEGDVYEIMRRERDREIELRVTLAGVPCILTYTLEEKPEHTEVTAALEPYGWRWVLFNVATLGLRRNNFEVILVQGLANLKAEVEGDLLDDLEEDEVTIIDEEERA